MGDVKSMTVAEMLLYGLEGCSLDEHKTRLRNASRWLGEATHDLDALRAQLAEAEKKWRRMCVCGHAKTEHERHGGVLACTHVENFRNCACGPGCIHEGFVCDDGTVQKDEALDDTYATLLRQHRQAELDYLKRDESRGQLLRDRDALRAALETIAWKPIGPADATYREAFEWVTEIAKAAIAAVGSTIPNPRDEQIGALRAALVRLVLSVGAPRNAHRDWACVECRPESDALHAGFRCAYHHAAALAAVQGKEEK